MATASPGETGFAAIRQCVMANDPAYCRSLLTPGSYGFFNRFFSYKLMPCLPTDFTYAGETNISGYTIVKATMPAGGGRQYILKLAFISSPRGEQLDLPASFQIGLGKNWRDKVQMGEQLYLMMRANMGAQLTCDKLSGILSPKE